MVWPSTVCGSTQSRSLSRSVSATRITSACGADVRQMAGLPGPLGERAVERAPQARRQHVMGVVRLVVLQQLGRIAAGLQHALGRHHLGLGTALQQRNQSRVRVRRQVEIAGGGHVDPLQAGRDRVIAIELLRTELQHRRMVEAAAGQLDLQRAACGPAPPCAGHRLTPHAANRRGRSELWSGNGGAVRSRTARCPVRHRDRRTPPDARRAARTGRSHTARRADRRLGWISNSTLMLSSMLGELGRIDALDIEQLAELLQRPSTAAGRAPGCRRPAAN